MEPEKILLRMTTSLPFAVNKLGIWGVVEGNRSNKKLILYQIRVQQNKFARELMNSNMRVVKMSNASTAKVGGDIVHWETLKPILIQSLKLFGTSWGYL